MSNVALSDVERIRRVIPAVQPPPLLEISRNPPALGSSIRKAEAAEPIGLRSHPRLPPPRYVVFDIADTHRKAEQVAGKQTGICDAEVKSSFAEIERLDAEKLEKLRQHARAAGSEKTWDILLNVAQYIMAGTSIVLGAAAIAALPVTPWFGAMLIASGVFGLAGKMLQDTGLLSLFTSLFHKTAELQKSLAQKIEMGFFFLSCGFGFAGGLGAYQAGAFTALNTVSRITKVAQGIGTGMGVAGTGARLAMSCVEKKKYHLQADLDIITAKTDLLSRGSDQSARDLQHAAEGVGELGDTLKQIIEALRVHSD